jgi:hypothetical protein
LPERPRRCSSSGYQGYGHAKLKRAFHKGLEFNLALPPGKILARITTLIPLLKIETPASDLSPGKYPSIERFFSEQTDGSDHCSDRGAIPNIAICKYLGWMKYIFYDNSYQYELIL